MVNGMEDLQEKDGQAKKLAAATMIHGTMKTDW